MDAAASTAPSRLRFATRLALLLLAGLVGAQGLALSFQRGAGNAHVHLGGRAGEVHEHGPSADHHHDADEPGVIYLEDEPGDADEPGTPPVVRDLDKVIVPAATVLPPPGSRVGATRSAEALRSAPLHPPLRPPDA